MKNFHIQSAIALLVIALNLALVPGARADRQSRADATAILTSGEWHFQGKHFSDTRVFDPKGTMTRHGNGPKETEATWKADYKEIVISFSYYHDTLFLPIDPKGTKGIDAWGDEFTATMANPGGAAVATGAPSGLDSLPPMSAPATAGGNQTGQTGAAAIIAQLTAKKWLFTGNDWTEKRVFLADGTMMINGAKNAAVHWQIADNQIVMTFPDRKEVMFLPLDPTGTNGKDGDGFDFTATQLAEVAPQVTGGSSNTWKPVGGNYFGSSDEQPATTTSTATPAPSQ